MPDLNAALSSLPVESIEVLPIGTLEAVVGGAPGNAEMCVSCFCHNCFCHNCFCHNCFCHNCFCHNCFCGGGDCDHGEFCEGGANVSEG